MKNAAFLKNLRFFSAACLLATCGVAFAGRNSTVSLATTEPFVSATAEIYTVPETQDLLSIQAILSYFSQADPTITPYSLTSAQTNTLNAMASQYQPVIITITNQSNNDKQFTLPSSLTSIAVTSTKVMQAYPTLGVWGEQAGSQVYKLGFLALGATAGAVALTYYGVTRDVWTKGSSADKMTKYGSMAGIVLFSLAALYCINQAWQIRSANQTPLEALAARLKDLGQKLQYAILENQSTNKLQNVSASQTPVVVPAKSELRLLMMVDATLFPNVDTTSLALTTVVPAGA